MTPSAQLSPPQRPGFDPQNLHTIKPMWLTTRACDPRVREVESGVGSSASLAYLPDSEPLGDSVLKQRKKDSTHGMTAGTDLWPSHTHTQVCNAHVHLQAHIHALAYACVQPTPLPVCIRACACTCANRLYISQESHNRNLH